ncbi:siderophore-iron reductase FhuF [Marinospirillum sp.]|uniref:siderophore-iron reductase FhuF n=1 Tax=Marinospirillum sp. TaxID=2183934 RepID=UPI003A87D682
MSQTLSTLYVGPLEDFAPPLVSPTPGPLALPATELQNPNYLQPLLTRFGAQYGPEADLKAVASLWSKWHFSTLITTALAPNLLLGRDLPVGLKELHVTQSADGKTTGFTLVHAGQPLSDQDDFSRFKSLIDQHLSPLISTLASVSGASAKVFWSNAGNYLEFFTSAIQAHPLAVPTTNQPAQRLLESRSRPDGQRNPLYLPVRYIEAEDAADPKRIRRLCCLRYLIDELGYCGNCPVACRRHSEKKG